MKKYKLIFLSLLFLIFSVSFSFAQQIQNSTIGPTPTPGVYDANKPANMFRPIVKGNISQSKLGDLGIGVATTTAGYNLTVGANGILSNGKVKINNGQFLLGDWSSIRTADNNGRVTWYGNAEVDTYLQSEAASRITQHLGDIVFYTAPTGVSGDVVYWSEVMRVNDNGNVGIGVITPEQKLSVDGNIVATGTINANQFCNILGTDCFTPSSSLGTSSSTPSAWTISGFNAYSNVQGNIGIGVTSPQNKLEVVSENFGIHATGNTGGGFFQDGVGSAQATVANNNTGITAQGSLAGGVFNNTSNLAEARLAIYDYGILSKGSVAGGEFEDLQGSSIARVAYGGLGISATGNNSGGYFEDTTQLNYAYIGYNESPLQFGIYSQGVTGGYFRDISRNNEAYLAYNNVDEFGIKAQGVSAGGYFENTNNTSYAYVGRSGVGVSARGDYYGGLFSSMSNLGYAYVGYGNFGIYSEGSFAGGYFRDIDGTGYAYVGYGNFGIEAQGGVSGGYFRDETSNNYAYIGYSLGLQQYGVYAQGVDAGGYFKSAYNSSWASLADGGYGGKFYGSTIGGYFYNSSGDGYAEIGIADVGVQGRGSYLGGMFLNTNSNNYVYLGTGSNSVEASGGITTRGKPVTYWCASNDNCAGTPLICLLDNSAISGNITYTINSWRLGSYSCSGGVIMR